jgi:hypothetical protein
MENHHFQWGFINDFYGHFPVRFVYVYQRLILKLILVPPVIIHFRLGFLKPTWNKPSNARLGQPHDYADSQIHQRHFRIQMASSSTDSRDPLQSSRRVFCPPAMERNIPNMWTKKRVHCGYELKLNVNWNMDIDFTCKLKYISRSWLFLHWIETLKFGYVWLAASLCCLSDVVSLDVISIWNSPLVEVFYDFAKQKTKTCIGW